MQKKLAAAGGTLIAVAADKMSDSQRVHSKNNLSFDLLCDEGAKVIRKYGLLFHEPYQDLDVALPTNILIDRGGTIAWMHVAEAVQDRVDPRVLMERIDALTK